MNKTDTLKIRMVIATIVPLVGQIEEALATLEPMGDAAAEKWDGMSERVADSERGQTLGHEAEEFINAKDELEAARDALDNALNALSEWAP